MSNPLSALDMLSSIALSEYSNISSNNVSGFNTPRDGAEEHSENHHNVTRQFRSPSMHAKELNEHDFHRALSHPVTHSTDNAHQLLRIKRDYDGNHVSVATGQLLVPPGTPIDSLNHVPMKAYIASPHPNSAVTTPLRPTFHKQGVNIMGSNGTMMVHGVGAGAQGNISSTDAHSSSWLQQPLLPPPPPPSSSLPFQYNPNQYPPVSVPGSLRISSTTGVIHRESPYTSRSSSIQQQPSSHLISNGGNNNNSTTPREPSKLMTYLERTRRALPTSGTFPGFTVNPHTPSVVPASPILGDRPSRSLTIPIPSTSTSCYRDGGGAMSGGSIQSGATSPMSCMSVESHDTFQSVVTRDRNLSVESIGSFDNRSTDSGQNPDLLNSIQQMRIRRLKMTTTPGGVSGGPTTVSSTMGRPIGQEGRDRGVSM